MEYLVDGWRKFVRVKCTSGFIDKWMGDCIDNPNNETKSNWNLNAFATFYRLNGGEWIDSRQFTEDLQSWTLRLCDTETAENIWNTLLTQHPNQ